MIVVLACFSMLAFVGMTHPPEAQTVHGATPARGAKIAGSA
jgi:hypothetical protein